MSAVADTADRHRQGGLARLAALVVLLAGILTMHGLATPASGGRHHLPLLEVSAAQLQLHPVAAGHPGGADGTTAATPLKVHPAEGTQTHDDARGLLAGCVVVLAGIVLTVLLLALQRGGQADRAWAAPVETQLRAPRAPPPRRPRIALCVLRV